MVDTDLIDPKVYAVIARHDMLHYFAGGLRQRQIPSISEQHTVSRGGITPAIRDSRVQPFAVSQRPRLKFTDQILGKWLDAQFREDESGPLQGACIDTATSFFSNVSEPVGCCLSLRFFPVLGLASILGLTPHLA